MTLPFLSVLRSSDAPVARWAVAASPYAARWAMGAGPKPGRNDGTDRAHARSVARRFGRLPATMCEALPGSFGTAMVTAVQDEVSFVRLFAPLFGVGLFGLERSRRRLALASLPDELSSTARREFELVRNQGIRPTIETTALFEDGPSPDLRAWVGARVAQSLGALVAEELAVVCCGWRADWQIPGAGQPPAHGLISAWVSTFAEGTQ